MDNPARSVVEKKRLTIWRKILIGLVVVALAWVAFQEYRVWARIERLGSMPPCQLAAEYMKWRLAFEESHPEAELTGSAADDFVDESEVFEQAVRRAQRVSQSRLLEELESLTTVDSTRWVREGRTTDPFVEVMIAECPDEVEGLLSGARR